MTTWSAALKDARPPAPTNRLHDETVTDDPQHAERAYRAILARDDLIGQQWVARLASRHAGVGGGRSAIYYSVFDRELGRGRIHPDAPLDMLRTDDGTAEAAAWLPPAAPRVAPHDWESDPRPPRECLRDWRDRHGWTTAQLADALRSPRATVQHWLDEHEGRQPAGWGLIRRLMTLHDRSEG